VAAGQFRNSVLNVRTGQEIAQIPSEGYRFGFSPDGKYLVASQVDKKVKVLNVHTGKITLDLSEQASSEDLPRFSADSQFLITPSNDNKTSLINLNTKQALTIKHGVGEGGQYGSHGGDISPAGKYAAFKSYPSRHNGVRNKPYDIGIWIQVYLGLRYEELAALIWDDLDLVEGKIFIRRAFIRTTGLVRDYPKGGRQHTKAIPVELLDRLRSQFVTNPAISGTDPVVPSTLGKYCLTMFTTKCCKHT
jgi:hypothetical protein